jgi:glycosyltransferase involved in cell wall biosynthesis
VRRAAQSLRFEAIISWFVVAHASALAGALSEDLIVYYCTDSYASFPDVDSREVARMDEDLTRRAALVFVSSSTLIGPKRELNSFVVHSPHGVDVDLFKQASNPDFQETESARSLKPPVIGFFGLIEAWIDLDLIAFLAKSRPAWTFLLVGRVAVDLGELLHLPNVVFAGPQKYEDLPRWAKVFDVANPLKLREYLATGKPVVTVSTPVIEQFRDYVTIASSPEEFLIGIERALAQDVESHKIRRISAVADMSWDRRTEEVLAVVEQRLSEVISASRR